MAAQRGRTCITDKLNAAHLSVYSSHSGTHITASPLLAFLAKKEQVWADCGAEIRPTGCGVQMIHQLLLHIEEFNQVTSTVRAHAWTFNSNKYFKMHLQAWAQHNTNCLPEITAPSWLITVPADRNKLKIAGAGFLNFYFKKLFVELAQRWYSRTISPPKLFQAYRFHHWSFSSLLSPKYFNNTVHTVQGSAEYTKYIFWGAHI